MKTSKQFNSLTICAFACVAFGLVTMLSTICLKSYILAGVTFVLFALVTLSPEAFAAKGDSLSAEEARTILNEVIPNVKIIHVKQSPVAGLWELGIDMGGKKAIVYLDHAKKRIWHQYNIV